MMDFRCTDPDCQHAAAGIPEPGDGSGYEAARMHAAATKHDMVFALDGAPAHKLDRTFMAWARKKGIIGAPVATPSPEPDGDGEDGDDPEGDPDEDEEGDYPGEDGDENDDDTTGGMGGQSGGTRRGGRPPRNIGVMNGYVLADQFSLDPETASIINSYIAKHPDLFMDDEGNEMPRAEKIMSVIGDAIVRWLQERPDDFGISRFIESYALDRLKIHRRALEAEYTRLDVIHQGINKRSADLAERERAVAEREARLGMTPGA